MLLRPCRIVGIRESELVEVVAHLHRLSVEGEERDSLRWKLLIPFLGLILVEDELVGTLLHVTIVESPRELREWDTHSVHLLDPLSGVDVSTSFKDISFDRINARLLDIAESFILVCKRQ